MELNELFGFGKGKTKVKTLHFHDESAEDEFEEDIAGRDVVPFDADKMKHVFDVAGMDGVDHNLYADDKGFLYGRKGDKMYDLGMKAEHLKRYMS